MAYIKRSLEKSILEISEDYSCLLLIGPRQVGKTTMLEHLMEGTERQKVTLDDVENRRLAKSDPALFLELHPAPVLIDEIQYAELFSYIKINVDNGAAPGSYSHERRNPVFKRGNICDRQKHIHPAHMDDLSL